MRGRSQIRGFWCCLTSGVLALALSAWADITPQSAAAAKKKTPHHLAGASRSSKRLANANNGSKASTHKTKHTRGKVHAKSRKRGQQAIDSERARQIQQALIRQHYLEGEPSGTWDAATQAAMQHYQADQGWQTKTIPDSRALIKLGLGPSAEHLLNPESAMTSSVASGSSNAQSKPNPDDPGTSPSDQSPSDPPQR